MRKGFAFCFILGLLLISSCSARTEERKWQREENFRSKRPVIYNSFVEEGGMKKKDEISNDENYVRNLLKTDTQSDDKTEEPLVLN